MTPGENDINILFDFIRSLEYTTFQFIKLARACIINLFIHVATINKGLNLNFNVYDLFFKQTSISTICTAWFRRFYLQNEIDNLEAAASYIHQVPLLPRPCNQSCKMWIE